MAYPSVRRRAATVATGLRYAEKAPLMSFVRLLFNKTQLLENTIQFVSDRAERLTTLLCRGSLACLTGPRGGVQTELPDFPGELERNLHAGKIQTSILYQIFDLPELFNIATGIEPEVALRAGWRDQALAFIFAQRLRVHLHKASCHADHEDWFVDSSSHASTYLLLTPEV